MARMHQINRGLPAALRDRLRQLDDKREAEALTLDEHSELVGLVAQVEVLEARRIESLSRLARLRGVSLPSLMDELGLHPPDEG
jgi:hypothetical protein